MGLLRRAHWAASNYRAANRSTQARAAAHPTVVVARKAPEGSVLGALLRLLIVLQLAGFVLADAWPDRSGASAAIAHRICATRPTPSACAPDGRPWEPIRDLLFR